MPFLKHISWPLKPYPAPSYFEYKTYWYNFLFCSWSTNNPPPLFWFFFDNYEVFFSLFIDPAGGSYFCSKSENRGCANLFLDPADGFLPPWLYHYGCFLPKISFFSIFFIKKLICARMNYNLQLNILCIVFLFMGRMGYYL